MHKYIVTILALLCIYSGVSAQELKQLPLKNKDVSLFQQGVIQYKTGNYVGSLQTMSDVIKKDPSNAIAHYYLAISYVKTGNRNGATKSYNDVLSLNPNSQVASYARTGLKCLNEPDKCQVDLIDGAKKIQNSLLMPVSESVKKTIETNRLNHIQEIINSGKDVEKEELEKLNDFSNKKSENTQPTNAEVVKALKVLKKAGLNPYNGMNNYHNSEMTQMNMLLSSMGGNVPSNNMNSTAYMSMMPYMMQQQGDQKVDPEVMQSMIQSMMMPDMFSTMSGFDNNKK